MVLIRTAKLEDFEFFYELKCEESNVFWTGHESKTDREKLFSFFSKDGGKWDKEGVEKNLYY